VTTVCQPAGTTWTQQTTAAAPTYTVPGAGVITSFSHNANVTPGSIRFVAMGPAALPTDRTVLGYSNLSAVTPSTLNTFATRVPVPAGASLALFDSANNMGCAFGTVAGDGFTGAIFDPAVLSAYTAGGSFGGGRINLSAIWEPDVDADQYGDVSQDACPQSNKTQAPCPAPDTTVTKKPKKKSTDRSVKVKFSSDPGSTYTCALDGKAAKACTSPYKKRLGYGTHKMLITSTSQYGIVDATPAKVKFKILKP
jgi:hypothetical protein